MSKTRTYVDFIPTLRQLMPQTGGIPGFSYAQVIVSNLTKLQNDPDATWYKTKDLEDAYTIKGPKGSADVVLCCTGKAIPGQDPSAGARICWVDQSILNRTGLMVPEGWEDFVADFAGIGNPPPPAVEGKRDQTLPPPPSGKKAA